MHQGIATKAQSSNKDRVSGSHDLLKGLLENSTYLLCVVNANIPYIQYRVRHHILHLLWMLYLVGSILWAAL